MFTTGGKPNIPSSGPEITCVISVADTIRLVDNLDNTALTGRIEIFSAGQWGTVCDDAWDINDAHVVCRQIGFPQASQAFQGATHGQGSGPIWMSHVACSGSESYIDECGNIGWGESGCTHNKDASVQCSSVIP